MPCALVWRLPRRLDAQGAAAQPFPKPLPGLPLQASLAEHWGKTVFGLGQDRNVRLPCAAMRVARDPKLRSAPRLRGQL